MRIGIDVRLWSESGVGRYIRNLIWNLAQVDDKNEYVLFCLGKDKDEILNQVQNDNFRIVQSDIRWHTIAEQLIFPSLLKKEQLDLVHFPYFSVPIFYKGKFIVTIHDLIINHFDTGEASTLPLPFYKLKRLGYRFIINNAIKSSEKIITVSNITKEEILSHYKIDPQKIVVTYEGVDDKVQSSKFKVQSLEKHSYFLYVGNAYPHKNLSRLLEAFAVLKEKNIDAQLIMVGKEDFFYKKLKQFVTKLGISDCIEFRHEVHDDELANFYENALALISPSLMEGFGLPLLEAMARKCLALVSDIPVYREIAKDCALYFDPVNVNDLVAKMVQICSNDSKHYVSFIHKGVKRASLFSWKKMAEETLNIYESSVSLRSG